MQQAEQDRDPLVELHLLSHLALGTEQAQQLGCQPAMGVGVGEGVRAAQWDRPGLVHTELLTCTDHGASALYILVCTRFCKGWTTAKCL